MSNNDKHKKKESIRKKMLEREGEAKVVRKIVFMIVIILSITISIIAAGGYFYIKSAMQPVNPDDHKEKKIDIPIGSSVSDIGKILEDKGIIKNARVFKYYVKFKNEGGFMAGDYKMKSSMTMPEIVSNLKTGKVIEEVVFKITIPEGKQLKQIAAIIAEKTDQKPESVMKTLDDRTFIKSLMNKYPDILTNEILDKNIKHPLEGYLFPATYSFYKADPATDEIITKMLDKTEDVIMKYRDQLEGHQLKTVHQLLTMSSLIEEEATAKADRHQISSVFYNRMKKGMPLQTDPTVLYAQGEHKSRVLYKDLKIDSPYNTYKYKGLPPGPIANAGVVSIEAAIEPAQSDYLYFLATSTGEVKFSITLKEHNEKKAQFITNKK